MRFILPGFSLVGLRGWNNVSDSETATVLANRLQKFWCTQTPIQTLKNGETWGNGQVEILMNHDGRCYRGQIEETKPYSSNVLVPTNEGVSLKFYFKWLALKHVSEKPRPYEMVEHVWEWELLQSPSLSFTILEFRQSKDCSHGGILYPKRLFFRKKEGEENGFCEGQFFQNHDPENLTLKDGVLIDPLQPD